MTDQELDRRLAEAFDVDHSPALLARVRTAIAAQPEPSRWHWRWSLSVATAAAAITMMVVAFQWRAVERSSPADSPTLASTFASSIVAHREALEPRKLGGPEARTLGTSEPRNLGTSKPRNLGTSNGFPEVIVAADDVRGLKLLMRSAQKAVIAEALPMDSVSRDRALALPRLERIAPVDIAPLPPVTRLEQGDRP